MQTKRLIDIPRRLSRKAFAAGLAATLLTLSAALAFNLLPAQAQAADPPAAPTGLSASGVSSDSVTLNWDDPGDSSITGHQALRRSRDGSEYGDGEGAAEFAVIADDTGSAATTYTDASVTPRTRYVYRVKAINPAGTSGQSSYLNVETLAVAEVPEAPTGLSAPSATHESVTLTWDDPGDSSITGHQVLRRFRDGDEYGNGEGAAEFAVIEENTGSAATTHTDASVTARTRYTYSMKAINPAGTSGQSGYLNVDTPEAPPERPLSPARGSRPNVVLILADDLGWGDVETNNPDSAMTTPRIDGIAAAGVNFTDAHSPSSNCTGTRYGLLTGRYSWRSWMGPGVLNGYDRPLIGPDRPTLGILLQGHGYRTAAVGKWHLGMDFARLPDAHEVTEINRGIDFDAEIVDSPIDHGFDEFFGTSANLTWPVPVYIRNNRFTAIPDGSRQPATGNIRANEVLDRLTDEAVSFIEREGQTEEPFFLYLPLNAPHVPLAPNAHFDGLTGLGLYADFVAQVDWTVGQVLAALERVGVHDDTLVIFTSDNGSFKQDIPIPNHDGGVHRSSGGWSAYKGSLRAGGHRIPFLLQWPAVIQAGSTVDATVSLTDLYATLAEIVGEEPAPGEALDSVSLLPILLGNADTRGVPVLHYSTGGKFAIRDGRWKLLLTDSLKLFDLEQDPGEDENVAGAYPAVVERLKDRMAGIQSAEDGALSGDATLRSLLLAGIDFGPFDPEVRSYTATVGREIATVEVIAIPTETDARTGISTPNGRLLYGKPARGRVEVGLADPITTIRVRVVAADGSATKYYTVTVTLVGTPTITGTAQVGETLTMDTSGITGADGLDDPDYSYQWVRINGSAASDIAGATGTTYILTTEDEGKTILVRVSFTDDGGNAGTRTSAATDTVVGAVEELVWGSELTAGRKTDTHPVQSGYSISGNLGGILSPDVFVIDGTTYRVRHLVHASESLRLGMYRELPVDFTLRVGDSTYLGSESMVPPSIDGVHAYWWPSAQPDWSADAPVPVSLTVQPKVPLGNRQKAPVTGEFRNFRTEHDGSEDISFRIYFSEGVPVTADALRDHVLSVTGGAVSSVEAVGSEGRIWAVSVTSARGESITVRIEADLDCALPRAICTADGRRLFNNMELPGESSAPAGAPTISGTFEVGETLTADTSGISDADGLTGATFSYQWVSYDGNADTDIPGATGSTYTLVPADEGKSFRVRVSFTDDAGFEESLTSALFGSEQPYGLNASASDGAVVLTWQLPAGWPYSSTFQILRNRPELGEAEPLVLVKYLQSPGNTYSDTDVESGVLYVYRVREVDPFGYTGEASELVEIRAGESTPVENTPATGAPAVSGAVQVGGMLTADTSDIADEDGLDGATFSHQWLADDSDISGATASTYTLVEAVEGKTIKVYVSFTDDNSNDESLTSAATGAVAAAPPTNNEAAGAPAISGTVKVGHVLTADITGIADADGLDNASFSHQWVRSDGGVDTDIGGATNATYELQAAEQGHPVKVRVSFTDDEGNEETLTSAATAEVAARSNTPAAGAPTINGAVEVGDTLTADTTGIADADGLNNAVFSHQWVSNDGTIDADISGATESTYTLKDTDEGKTVKVRVTFTDNAGNEETMTSDATPGVVGATSQPVDFHILDAPTGENEAVLYRSTATLTPVNHIGNTHDSREERRASFKITGGETLRLPLLDKLLIGSLSAPISATDLTIPLTSVSGLRPGESIQVGADGGELIRIASLDVANQTITVAERYQAPGESFVAPRAWPAETVVYHHRRARPERLPGYMVESGERPTFRNFRMVWSGLDVPYLAISLHFTGSDTELKNWRELLVYLRFRRGDDQGTMIEGILPLGADGELKFLRQRPGNPYTVREQHLRRYLGWPEDMDSDPDGSREVSFVDNARRAIRFVGGSERTFLQEIVDWIYADDGHDLGRIYESDDRYSSDELEALQDASYAAFEGLVRSYQVVVDLVFLDGTDPRINTDKFSIGPENAPATGAPTISGKAQVGETLTADTTSISDADGLDNADFDYQWLADDTAISGAISSTYTLVANDEGRAIKVRVSFTDDEGHSESLTSEATGAVTAGLELRSATVDGLTLTLTYSEVLDTGVTLPVTAFIVNVNGSPRSLDSVSVGGSAVTLTLFQAVEEGDPLTVDYAIPDGPGSIRDTRGREAESFSGREVTNNTPAAGPEEPSELTAEFLDTPESHDGSAVFTFELRLSEEPKEDFSYTTLRDHAFTVTGGGISGVGRLEPPGNVRWQIEVTPSSDASVTIVLPVTTDCGANGAVCTDDGRMLSSRLEFTVPGPPRNTAAEGGPAISGAPTVGQTLSAVTTGISDADGLANAVFNYQWLAGNAEIAGATNAGYTVAETDLGEAISVRVTFIDDAGNEETLTSAATEAVAAAQPPLTAEFLDAPESHDGSAVFTFELRLSEEPKEDFSYQTLLNHAFTVTGGEISGVRRLEPPGNIRWEIQVRPNSGRNVGIVLPITTDCAADGAVCTGDGRMLSNRLEITVPEPGG